MNYQPHFPSLSEFTDSLAGVIQPVILLEGSREVAAAHEPILIRLGALLSEALPHALFRSGNAGGSDTLFAEGVKSVDPSRMQVVTPSAGHRKSNLHRGYQVHCLAEVSEVRETALALASNEATPANQRLMDARKKNPRLGAKAKYLLRDTLKVLGDLEQNLKPADVGIFYTKPDPMAGGTGHTIRVCQQHNVPVYLFHVWQTWLGK